MHEERVLGNPHRVGHARGAVIGLATIVRVGVREYDFRTTTVHPLARTGSFHIIIIPSLHHSTCQRIAVMVVIGGGSIAVKRSHTFLMIGITVIVPILAKALIPIVFHLPIGLLATLVHVKHLATVLRLVNIKHFPAANGSPAKRVILVSDLSQLDDMLTRDALVATLIEEDTGIVATIDNGVTHEFHTMLPLPSGPILLGIARRHGLNQSHAVAAFHILFPRGDVHPSHEVAPRLHLQLIAVIRKPCRNTHPHARPLVACALGVAMNHDDPVVEPNLPLGKAGLPESSTHDVFIHHNAVVGNQSCLHRVEIAISPTPEMRIVEPPLGVHHARFTGLKRMFPTLKPAHLTVILVKDRASIDERPRFVVVISHLRLGMNRHLFSGNVIVFAIDIYSRGLEIRVQGQRLIQLVGHVQPHILGDAAIVGVEILVVPLVS